MHKPYILTGLLFFSAHVWSSEDTGIEEFISKATNAAKEKNYKAYSLLYCEETPKTLRKPDYFVNERKIFSKVTLHEKNTLYFNNKYFGDVNYDYVLSLCSYTKETKELCMIQPVIKSNKGLCIVNI